MSSITIKNGNLFDSDAKIICHQCNAQGKMNSGVAKEARERYPHVFNAYKNEYTQGLLKLGHVCFAEAKENQIIANLISQKNYGYDRKQYTDYVALQECLNEVKQYAYDNWESTLPKIAFPYLMSCHRGGGDWSSVYKMIEDTFEEFDIEIWRLN